MRMKHAKPASFHRAMRSRVASKRPTCPNCGMRAPGPDEVREEWALPFGHRRPQDGEPCPGVRESQHVLAPPPPLPEKVAPRLPAAAPTGPACQLALFAVPVVERAVRQRRRVRIRAASAQPRRSSVAPVLPLFELLKIAGN